MRIQLAAGPEGTGWVVALVAPSPPPYGGMALQAGLLEKLLRHDGVGVVCVPSNFNLPGWLTRFGGVPFVRTALRAVLIWAKVWTAAGQSDVIHIFAASWWYFFSVALPATVVGRVRGKRVVLNYRGGEAREFFKKWGWSVGPVLRIASAVTAPSEFLASTIRSRFAVPVAVVPNIVDLSAFPFRQRTMFRPRLLINRHLEAIYDIETVLRCFRAVQNVYPDAVLHIAGTGSEENRLRASAAAWHLNNVHFLGHVRHEDLPGLYNDSDILLNASRVDNFPGALIEASAAGLAVVSTDAGGIPYIYRHESTALLVRIGDWQGLAAAVCKVLEDPAMASNITSAALSVAKRCDWSEVRKHLYHIYGLSDWVAARSSAIGDAEGRSMSGSCATSIPSCVIERPS